MKLAYDPRKRARTLAERGLDFRDCEEVFAGPTIDAIDDRTDYGEPRMITAGHLRQRMVVVVWTPRGETRHIISMRYCHEKEERRWRRRLEGSGSSAGAD